MPSLVSVWKLRMSPARLSLPVPLSPRVLVPPPPSKLPVITDPVSSVSVSLPPAKERLPRTVAPVRLMKVTLLIAWLPITLALAPSSVSMTP